MAKKQEDKFSEAETQKRFEAALRGARIAGAKHRETPRKAKVKSSRKKGK